MFKHDQQKNDEKKFCDIKNHGNGIKIMEIRYPVRYLISELLTRRKSVSVFL